MEDIRKLFAGRKPLIAMMHLLPTLGTPLYDVNLTSRRTATPGTLSIRRGSKVS